ncbi:hypothetical protein GGX14DRAFT_387789 [Mycena pura]|uniref:Apple domain-containing protein n=1 Tax=Mycena pura TaxID=153505 RepID=A0AAD6YM80_9AGAR|nr:hypothetical protein GGX14DRAFT_387789 [Mycena pura]
MLSSLVAVLVSFSLSAAVAVGPTPDAVGNIFAVYPGWDMNNGGTPTIHGGSELACLQACSASATCVAYAYVPYGSNVTGPGTACVLKNSFNIATFTTQSFDLSVGLLGACGTFSPAGIAPQESRCMPVSEVVASGPS